MQNFILSFNIKDNKVVLDSLQSHNKHLYSKELNLPRNLESVFFQKSFSIYSPFDTKGQNTPVMEICKDCILVFFSDSITGSKKTVIFDDSNSTQPLDDACILFNILNSSNSNNEYDNTIGKVIDTNSAHRMVFGEIEPKDCYSEFLHRILVG